MAAGLSLLRENLPAFRAAFAAEITTRLSPELRSGVIESDGELPGGEICLDTARALRSAGPWGQGFPEPVFDGIFEVQGLRIVGEKHLKLKLRASPRGESIDAIAFGYVGGATESASLRAGARVQVAYRLEVNEYNGAESVQLNCQHLQVAPI